MIICCLYNFWMKYNKVTSTMLKSIEKWTFPLITVGPKEPSFFSFHFITFKWPLVLFTVAPFDYSISFFLAVNPLSYILFRTISKSQFTCTIPTAIQPASFIYPSGSNVFALTWKQIFSERTLINMASFLLDPCTFTMVLTVAITTFINSNNWFSLFIWILLYISTESPLLIKQPKSIISFNHSAILTFKYKHTSPRL